MTVTSALPRLRHSGAAVAALFFVNGMTFSNWLPRVPEVRDRLGLGNAGIGAVLLGGGLGGIVGALLVGRLSDRFGSKRLLLLAASALAIGLPMIGIVPVAPLLLVVLTVLGALDVFNDVSMNAQGVMIQERLGRSIMNRLHAMWSLGFLAGAVIGSAMAAAGVGVRPHLVIVGALLLAAVQVARRWLLPIDDPHEPLTTEAGAPARPPRVSPVVVLMAAAALAAMALETMPNEWAAVMMRDDFDLGKRAGFGTVTIAGSMLVGRLVGDHVLDRVGERRLLLGAVATIAAGVVITASAPVAAVAFAGLLIWGLGLSVVFPQLYASAARLPGTSAGTGLGSMLFGQRFGTMVTAAGVGVLAEWRSVRFAFFVVGLLAMAVLMFTIRGMHRLADGRG